MHRVTLFKDTDHTVSHKLTDQNGDTVSGATVTLSVADTDITLQDQGDGVYTGAIPADIDVTPGRSYTVKLVSDTGQTQRTFYGVADVVNGSFH